MALFKILSNMTDTTKNLPTSYHQGYCYFDVKTGKFWIDTSDLAPDRIAINSSFYGVCTSEALEATKVVACPGYVESTGAMIFVRFTVTNMSAVSSL